MPSGILALLVIAVTTGVLVWVYGRGQHRPGGSLRWGGVPDLAAVLLLAVTVLGFFWRVVTGQNWMPADGGDLVSFLFPTYRFAAATMQRGAWPLWNPYLYVGAPHVADIQAGFLYPPNLLLFWLGPQFPYVALQWLSLAHIWWAGVGTYLFLARGCRLGRLPALAGALAFMFSDALIVHFGNLNFNAVVSWLPWIVWSYLCGLQPDWAAVQRSTVSAIVDGESASIRPGWAVLAGALLALATFAGHVQATLFILLALAIYTLVWLYLNRSAAQPIRRALQALGYGALMLLITVVLAAPVLLPALQLTGYTLRAAWNYQEAAGYSIAPAQWIGLLIPGFFGRAPQFHWGAWPRVEVGYLGIFPLVLVAVAIALRRSRWVWSWIVLAALAFLLSLGTYALPHGWLTLLPGFGQLRAPARLVFVVDFSLAVLAASGLAAALAPFDTGVQLRLRRVTRGVGYAAGLVWGVSVPLAYLALLLLQDRDPAVALRTSVALIGVMLFAGLLLASWLWLVGRHGGWAASTTLGVLALVLIYIDLGSTGAYQDLGNEDPSQSFRQPAIAGYLQAQSGPFRIDTRTDIQDKWQPDTALLYGLEDVTGLANPLLLADVERYWGGLGSRSSRLYDLLNVRYIIARKDVVLDWEKFGLAFDGSPDLNVYQNRRAMPRALLVSQWQVAPDHEAAWQAIHAPGFDPAVIAVVEGAPERAAGGQGRVIDVREVPNGLSVHAEVNGPALLVLSQVWYPGWRVWVDGVPRGEPLRADYLFQGVPLDAGSHQIDLRFAPPLWSLGWGLAGAGALVCLAWLVIVASRRRRA